MSKPQISFLVAGLLAALLLFLAPGGVATLPEASAASCAQGQTGTLVIKIYDEATGVLLSFAGAEVLVNPDPRDFDLDHIVVDTDIPDASGTEDHEPSTGIIGIDKACSTQGSESYTASIYSLPTPFDDCEIVDASDSGKLAVGGTTDLKLKVDCTGVGPTPTVGPTSTATVTPTAEPPSQIASNASPLEVSCNGTSIVTFTVRDSASNPVGAGTVVTLSTSFGTLNPSGSQLTNNVGNVVAFFTAPASSGGVATITAVSGTLKGMAVVNVKCGGTAAINTVAPSGGTGFITPPNTGDAGLAASDTGMARDFARLLAGAAVLVAASWLLRRPSVCRSER